MLNVKTTGNGKITIVILLLFLYFYPAGKLLAETPIELKFDFIGYYDLDEGIPVYGFGDKVHTKINFICSIPGSHHFETQWFTPKNKLQEFSNYSFDSYDGQTIEINSWFLLSEKGGLASLLGIRQIDPYLYGKWSVKNILDGKIISTEVFIIN